MATVPNPMTWVAGLAGIPTAAQLNGTDGPKGVGDFLLDPPRVSVYMTTASLTHNTWTGVTWTATHYDTDSMWDSGDPTRLTVNTPGRYLVTARAYFAANATGTRGINLTPNGAGVRDTDNVALSDSFWAAANSTNQLVTATFEWAAVEDDYLEMHAIQSSGGALNLVGSSSWTRLAMRWVALS